MDSYHHSQSLGYLTGVAARLLNNLLTSRFSAAGIDMTAEQWGVILMLLNHESMTQRQISDVLQLEKSTVSRSISGLYRRGWVTCSKSARDSRQKLVTLTPAALDVAERCAAIAKSVLEDAQTGLDDKAAAATRENLSEVIGNLRKLSH
ncbi:MAG TPA: MarR family transcriptional regulator [Thiolinea sp.]|nr:MarR family transcriptional regulator [Thiolinea sp.]